MEIEPIAIYHCPLSSKFGIPRQSGVVPELEGTVTLCGRGPEALRGIEGFDYLWLLWGFSANRPGRAGDTVRPPRLGGNKAVGVFASRSPYRPNPIGLSSVKLVAVEGCTLRVRGADLMDGTPIYDIKPYLPYADSHPGARAGFTDASSWKRLEVVIPEALEAVLERNAGPGAAKTVAGLLAEDPRPSYQDDPERTYGMEFGGMDIRFRVAEGVLSVTEVAEGRRK